MDGNERVVHCNLLLEVKFLPPDMALDGAAEPVDSLAGVASRPDLHESNVSTTRFGRVVRSVSRLIESMPEVTSLFGSRPVPFLVMIV